MNKRNLIIIILLFITVIYYIPIINSPLAPYDEAVIIVGAERIVEGQVPYKDFLTVYGPAQTYTLAALFKAFGSSVTVERIYDIVIKSLLSIIIYLLIRMLASHKTAVVGWAMSLVWIEYSYFHAYPVYPAALFTFLSIYFLLFHMKNDRLLYIHLSSISIIAAILFRHDLGGLAAVVLTLGLLLRKLMGIQKSWTPLIYFITTGVIASLPVIVYFIIYSDINAVLADLIFYPLDVPNQQGLPYPSLNRWTLPFYVFPAALIAGIIIFIIMTVKKMDNVTAFGILFISLVGIVFGNQAWARSDTIHLLPIALAAIPLSSILLHALSGMITQSSRLHSLFLVLFIVLIGITFAKPIVKKARMLPSNYKFDVVNPEFERAKYPYITPDIKKTASYIRENTAEDDYIYVGVKNHDKFIFNDAIIYFLAERKCATKYHELNPGHTTTLKIQEEMVGELRDKHVPLVVLAERNRDEPNQSSIDVNIDVLDDYISKNYELKESYGLFEIWIKKNI